MLRVFRNDDGRGMRESPVPSLAEAWAFRGVGTLWVDVGDPTASEAADLERACGFHPLAVEDALTPEQPPKVDEYDGYLFIVFRGLRREREGDGITGYKLAAFLGDGWLVTVHRRPVGALAAVASACTGRDVAWEHAADRVLHACIDRMTDELLPVLADLEDRFEVLEERIFDDPRPETLQGILEIKRELFRVRRLLHPQREMLGRLAHLDFPHVDRRTAVYFRDVYDHTAHAEDLAATLTELAAQTAESYLSLISNRLNEVMKVLTIFTAVLMPLTFLVGVYGMNLKGMPEMSWPWFYPFLWGVMAAIAGGLLLLFRRMKWL
jgi:magnesium transporter